MVDLDKANEPVRDNHRPQHPTEYSIDDKTDTSDQIDNPDFSYILQNKTQHYKK